MILVIAVSVCAVLLFAYFWMRERNRARSLQDKVDAMQPDADVNAVIARHGSDLACLLTEEGDVQWVSQSLQRLLGWRPQDVIGHSWKEYSHPDDLWLWHNHGMSLQQGSEFEPLIRQGRFRHQNGSWIWLEAYLTAIAHENLGPAKWLSELRNISQRKSVEIAQARTNARLAEQAAIDSMTGVFNRRHILLTLEKEAARARRNGHPLCVLLIDVDHFKPYNEHYGHTQGDMCLRDVARQIGASLQRPADTVGRHAGKEFMVLLPETDARGMRQVAEKIRGNIVDMRLEHAPSPLRIVTVSIGGVYLRADSESSPDIYIAMAAAALREAKRRGRDRVICNMDSSSALPGENVSLPAD